jgi:hypothetical protein
VIGAWVTAKAQVHAVLAKEGVAVPMTDLFGVGRPAVGDTPWLR